MDSDDDMPQLPADTLAALKSFYTERDDRQKAFEDLKQRSEDDFDASKPLSMSSFAEDWNASQFWYNDATATTLANQLLDGADASTRIAVVSAPSAFLQLKNLLNQEGKPLNERPQIYLLEFDERFSVFKSEFIQYDFEHATRLPAELKASFDRIICDPPFLSEDCQTRAALTVRWLAKDWSSEGLKLIQCTGERMGELMLRLYGKVGLGTTDFEIVHSKGLSNEFRCYANFDCEAWRRVDSRT